MIYDIIILFCFFFKQKKHKHFPLNNLLEQFLLLFFLNNSHGNVPLGYTSGCFFHVYLLLLFLLYNP